MEPFLFEAALKLSKRCKPGTQEIQFGRYTIRPIPTDPVEDGAGVLSFLDERPGSEQGSHPEEEAKMATAVFSLVTDTRARKTGTRLNHIDLPRHNTEAGIYPQFFGEIAPEQLDAAFQALYSLDDDLCRQFVRSAKTYALATEFITEEPTFAFFLLCVAAECLSSQDQIIPHAELNRSKKSCERYCRFLRENLQDKDKGEDERNDDLFTELLKTAYFSHRSAFAHGGKEVPGTTVMADGAKSSYFKSIADGSEVRTPGIGWFAGIVRSALVGFLLKQDASKMDTKRLWRLAFEKAGFTVKFRRSVKAHHAVTLDDIEYR